MPNVLIDKDKLDVLANAISNKSGEALTLTLDEMVDAVDGIETGGGGITPTGNINITSAGTTDVTNYATATVPSYQDVEGGYENEFYTQNNNRRWRIRYVDDGIGGWVNGGYSPHNYVEYTAIPNGTSITPTESAQSIGGSRVMMQGAVTVNAIPSNYVGSGITRRDSTDLTASGATVSVPSGYYASNASKAVSSGTEGTPTATKGTVTNHSVSITPSVTNTAGYISGGSHSGTAVSVSASELVSGSETKTENGTYDVTNLAELVVNVSGGTSKNTQVVQGTTRTTSSTMTAIGAELTVSKTGKYDIYWSAFRSNTSSSYTYATQLYIDNSAHGSENSTWSNHVQNNHLTSVSLTANQKIRVRGRNSRGSSYYIYAPTLVIVEN